MYTASARHRRRAFARVLPASTPMATSALPRPPMERTLVELLAAKRDGEALSTAEIARLVSSYMDGSLADYQMSALLMAIFFRGLDDGETVALTESMLHSGRVLDLSSVAGLKIDKHSTGGVGDKVSLCLAPLVAACGVPVPMVSGRGLGHTGGTLDKLEAIPGFRTEIEAERFAEIVARVGTCMIGQTREIAPADKRIYALRDVTATVECIPLIVASILSKKLAEGIDGLVLDVKVGRGAFMKDEARARALAEALVRVGTRAGKKVVALLTAMEAPLGTAVGNANETREAIDVLRGGGPSDLVECTLALGAEMIVMGGKAANARGGARAARTGHRARRRCARLRADDRGARGRPAGRDRAGAPRDRAGRGRAAGPGRGLRDGGGRARSRPRGGGDGGRARARGREGRSGGGDLGRREARRGGEGGRSARARPRSTARRTRTRSPPRLGARVRHRRRARRASAVAPRPGAPRGVGSPAMAGGERTALRARARKRRGQARAPEREVLGVAARALSRCDAGLDDIVLRQIKDALLHLVPFDRIALHIEDEVRAYRPSAFLWRETTAATGGRPPAFATGIHVPRGRRANAPVARRAAEPASSRTSIRTGRPPSARSIATGVRSYVVVFPLVHRGVATSDGSRWRTTSVAPRRSAFCRSS